MKTTTQKHRLHRKLMALLSKQGYTDEQRHDLVWKFTSCRTESTRDLSEQELRELCRFLEEFSAEMELLLRKKRATVLTIAQRCAIHDPEDWSKFNGFMKNRSICKKPLKDYTYEELNKLIQQFRKLEENYNRSANNYNTKAWWHRGRKLANLN